MGDQKLVGIHDVSFLVKKIILLDLINLQLLNKVCSLVRFHYFPPTHGSFALSVDVFKNIHQKLKSLNVMKCSQSTG